MAELTEKDAPVNILLVDDQPGKLLSYEAILAELGENIIKAGSGREALEQLLKQDITVVLIDVNMPEKDGITAAAEIYAEHPLPIILVSAQFGPEFLQRAGSWPNQRRTPSLGASFLSPAVQGERFLLHARRSSIRSNLIMLVGS